MDLQKKYFHWLWASNNIRTDKPNYLINLELGVSVKFDQELAMFASFEEFYKSIADVQFLYGKRPNDEAVKSILVDAWNYLAIEERILESDISEIDADDLF